MNDFPRGVRGKGPAGLLGLAGRSHYADGFADGIQAFRLHLPHAIPTKHPHGSTPEGRDWFLGCCDALERLTISFQQPNT